MHQLKTNRFPLPSPARLAQTRLLAAIEDSGFACSTLGGSGDEAATLLLSVGGMACAACSGAAAATLRATPGVLEASVSLLTAKAEVRAGRRW